MKMHFPAYSETRVWTVEWLSVSAGENDYALQFISQQEKKEKETKQKAVQPLLMLVARCWLVYTDMKNS